MAILNYTTKISAKKTVGEIQTILARQNAKEITIDFHEGEPAGLKFMIIFHEQPIYIRLPCNADGVLNALHRAKVPRSLRTTEQARRVAWRIIKDWVEAQMAIVEAGQAKLAEVFLPYVVSQGGETMFQRFEVSSQKQLQETNN